MFKASFKPRRFSDDDEVLARTREWVQQAAEVTQDHAVDEEAREEDAADDVDAREENPGEREEVRANDDRDVGAALGARPRQRVRVAGEKIG